MDVPDKVRRRAAFAGDTGDAWLADLPQQIADLERRWAITVGQPARRASEAFVAVARTSGGKDVILKIAIPGIDPTRQELRILRAANGSGYAKLIRGEKLGPQLHDFHFPEDECIEVICATLHEAWMPSLEGPPLVTAADKAVELSGFIAIFCSLAATVAVCSPGSAASSISRSGSGR